MKRREREKWPEWLLPRMTNLPEQFLAARSRLGRQAYLTQTTEEYRKAHAKHANEAWQRSTTPEQRKAISRKASAARWPKEAA